MCGISGFLEPPARRSAEDGSAIAARMNDALAHRGPDDRGTWCDPAVAVALGNRRLAVIDLSADGHQPMHSPCGRYVLAFNGEIYNFRALREELAALGESFRGGSDTEVVVTALSRWGIQETLERLNGMFALAVWDRQQRRLELARDRMGQKPLYYGWADGALLFASELKAFAGHPSFVPEVDRDALTLLLRRACIPAPHSIFRGVAKVEPGTRVAIPVGDGGPQRERVEKVPYWSVAAVCERGDRDPFSGSPEEAVETLDGLLRDAVKLCMVSDVPLGAFLSGGIDSSTVVALMQAQSDRPVRTFAIGFAERDFDEAQHAARVAAHLGTDHTELYVTEDDALAVVPELAQIYDEPFADSSQIPTFLVSSLARRHVTVALSGDGGDELFAGYTNYRYLQRLRHLARLPRPAVSSAALLLRHMPLPRRVRRPGSRRELREEVRRLAGFLDRARSPEQMIIHLLSAWKRPDEVVLGATEPRTALTDPSLWPRVAGPVRRAMALDAITYLPDDILVKVDRAAMAVSLETRIPMLDHRVVELAASLPLRLNLGRGRSKRVLRRVLHRYVPPELVERPKMGFSVPIDRWLRGRLREWGEDLLSPARLRHESYFDPQPVRELWDAHQRGEGDWGGYLWPVLAFQAWHRHWLAEGRFAGALSPPPQLEDRSVRLTAGR